MEDPADVYDAADLAVLPSHWEGLPHALIEALRAGLASVATDVGGIPEIVRHEKEGLLCPARSSESLADSIHRALSEETERKRWAEAARARYEAEFRVERMVEQLTEFYERVAAGALAPPTGSR
jgi:glycosyltransferase involved in cell wall biosynthesis